MSGFIYIFIYFDDVNNDEWWENARKLLCGLVDKSILCMMGKYPVTSAHVVAKELLGQ